MCVCALKVSTHIHTVTVQRYLVCMIALDYIMCMLSNRKQICCTLSSFQFNRVNRITRNINTCDIMLRMERFLPMIHATAAVISVSFITWHFYRHFNYCNQTVVETGLFLHSLTFTNVLKCFKGSCFQSANVNSYAQWWRALPDVLHETNRK